MTLASVARGDAGGNSHLPFVGLLRGELRRLRLRRLVVGLIATYLLAVVVTLLLHFFAYDANNPAAIQANYEKAIASCEAGFGASSIEPGEGLVGPAESPLSAQCRDDFGDAQAYARRAGNIYVLNSALPEGVLVTAVTCSLLGFLLGATTIGADWSARTLPGLLTWEPRRIRLLTGRLIVLLAVVIGVAVVAQVILVAGALLLAQFRGTFDGVNGAFWGEMAVLATRGVGLACLFAAVGFALAAMLRNTGAALGVAFGYLTLGEILMRVIRPGAEPYLITNNMGAWMTEGGIDVTVPSNDAFAEVAYKVVHLSVGRGGAYLLAIAMVLFALALVTFSRRDIN